MITYHQLQAFLAVVRLGSITKVGRELNASQPTVSLQLQSLRKFLGAPLFDRSGGGFRLTPTGERLRRYAEDALGGLRSLKQDVAVLQGTVAGPLAVGVTFVMSRYVLQTALSRFFQHFPSVEVQLYVEFPESLFRGLLRNSLDVACYIEIPAPAGLTVEKLREEPFVVFASPDHTLAGRRQIAAAELTPHPFVASVSPALRALIDAKLRAAGVTPLVAAETRHHDTIKQFVERGVGYSMLIKSSVDDELASGRLVALKLDGPPIMATLVAAYRPQPAAPVVREFIDFIRSELARPAVTAQAPRRPLPARRGAGSRRKRRATLQRGKN